MEVFVNPLSSGFQAIRLYQRSSVVEFGPRFGVGPGSNPVGGDLFLFFYFLFLGVILDAEFIGDTQNNLSFHLAAVFMGFAPPPNAPPPNAPPPSAPPPIAPPPKAFGLIESVLGKSRS